MKCQMLISPFLWFSKSRGTILGGPFHKDYNILGGSILGSPNLGKLQIFLTRNEAVLSPLLNALRAKSDAAASLDGEDLASRTSVLS